MHVLRSFVFENPRIGTVIGQVQAVDADSGTFGQIEYSLSAPSDRYLQM